MKLIITIILLGMAINDLIAIPYFSSITKQDTAVVVIDSLDCYRYHVSHMTLLLNEKPIHYTVVFDTIENYLKPQYQQIGGTVYPYNAIKSFGEKYRNGILIYGKKESEGSDE